MNKIEEKDLTIFYQKSLEESLSKGYLTRAKQSCQQDGYDLEDLDAIPQSSIIGHGCGNPIKYSQIKKNEVVVDLGSGAGIDVFLAAQKVGKKGKVIGIDMTDEMLLKAKENAQKNGIKNVEFRKGNIEKKIPIETNSADLVISNCVINLSNNKLNTFKEIFRILKPNGRIVISDLLTDRESVEEQIDKENWCKCIDGALTKDHYLEYIKKAGLNNIEILKENIYKEIEDKKISSVIIKASK